MSTSIFPPPSLSSLSLLVSKNNTKMCESCELHIDYVQSCPPVYNKDCDLTLYLCLDQDQVAQQELTIPCLQQEKKEDDTAVRVHVLRTIYYRHAFLKILRPTDKISSILKGWWGILHIIRYTGGLFLKGSLSHPHSMQKRSELLKGCRNRLGAKKGAHRVSIPVWQMIAKLNRNS